MAFCLKHKREIQYYCLDQNCLLSSPFCCVLCIKNEHAQCDSSRIVDSDAKLEFACADGQSKAPAHKALVSELLAMCSAWRSEIAAVSASQLDQLQSIIDCVSDSEKYILSKRYFSLQEDPETKKLVYGFDQQSLQDSIDNWEQEQLQLRASFETSLLRYTCSSNVLDARNFTVVGKCVVKQLTRNAVFVGTTSKENYDLYNLVYNVPLMTSRRFTISIDNL